MNKGDRYENKAGLWLEVVCYNNAKSVLVKFDLTGYEVSTQASKIKSGSVKDVMSPYLYGVGFFGSKQRSLGDCRKSYDTWRHMMYRCYDEMSSETHPTYDGCTVCDEWHNFTLFNQWYSDNYIDGHHLDKDVRVDGNKVYSPSTCKFITIAENQMHSHAKVYEVTTPCGTVEIVSPLSAYCKDNGLSQPNMNKVANGERKHHKGYKVKALEETQSYWIEEGLLRV